MNEEQIRQCLLREYNDMVNFLQKLQCEYQKNPSIANRQRFEYMITRYTLMVDILIHLGFEFNYYPFEISRNAQ